MAKLIYVVDDEPDACEVLETMLRMNKYDTESFTSGRDLIEALQNKRPILLLLDILMPGMDGIQLCKYIKQNPKLADIKICIISALTTPEDIEKGMSAGADSYIKKPIQNRKVLEEVKKLVGGPDS